MSTATTLYLDDELLDWLRVEAARRRTSMSRLVSEALKMLRADDQQA